MHRSQETSEVIVIQILWFNCKCMTLGSIGHSLVYVLIKEADVGIRHDHLKKRLIMSR